MSDTLIIRRPVANSAHIRSAGSFEAVLIGTSDTDFTEQLLTLVKIPVGPMRGVPKILLQSELLDASALVKGTGVNSLVLKNVDNYGFQVLAIHNLPAAQTVNIRVLWFAFGYEGTVPDTSELTRQNNQIVPLSYCEKFTAVTDTIKLAHLPIHDATLIVWSDRIPMFFGHDYTVNKNVITLTEPLTGVESVVVTYTTRTSEVL